MSTKQDEKQKAPEHAVPGLYEFDEVLESMTGVEEDEVYAAFGSDVVAALGADRTAKAMRALIFVLHRRDGVKPGDAKKTAQGMRFGDLSDFFKAGDQGSGEGESGPSSEPKTTPRSASASGSTPPSTED